MHLQTLDYAVVLVYGVLLLILAQWVSREKAGHEKNTQDYFLAGRALPWWAIGASLIAANISAEQIIGMSGSAFVLGIAIASYEWMAALTLIIVGKWLLPVFLKHRIYTMPQFLEQRFDHRVRMVMATFWLGVYVFVNLTSILWLGSLAINSVTGIDQTWGLVFLGLFAVAYSLYGGLKAVALTDIIQVVLLVLGGLLIAWISMNEISGGQGAIAGFAMVLEAENVIARNRLLMGATDPKKADRGTIRADLADNVEQNIVHGSDAPETAETEINYFFSKLDIIS